MKAIHMHTRDETNANPIWLQILENSYWAIQRNQTLANLEKELTAARTVLSEKGKWLTDVQRQAFQEKDALEIQIKTQTNAKKKAAQNALRRWEEDHTGANWVQAAKLWISEKTAATEVATLESQHNLALSASPENRLYPALHALHAWGYLNKDTMSLTQKGILATEVNEGNPFLMTELYLSGIMKDASAEEIVTALACMLTDREALEKSADTNIRSFLPCVLEALQFLDYEAQKGERIDRQCGVHSPDEFWQIAPFWMEVVRDWLNGEEAGVIAHKYELYEGNFMRGLLKIANLLNEWIAMATFCGDVDMLDRLRDTPQQLLRDIAQPESLYLHL
jgi:superfamily II RNA helicase